MEDEDDAAESWLQGNLETRESRLHGMVISLSQIHVSMVGTYFGNRGVMTLQFPKDKGVITQRFPKYTAESQLRCFQSRYRGVVNLWIKISRNFFSQHKFFPIMDQLGL